MLNLRMRSIGAYVLLTALFYAVMYQTAGWHLALRLALNTLLILLFCAHIYWHEIRRK